MLETIEDIRGDSVSRNVLKLIAEGWMPIKVLISKLGADRHTAYSRFKALEKLNLIEKSKRKHEASRYRIFGFNLTESGKIFLQENIAVPSISLTFPMHAFVQNYILDIKLYAYPGSKALEFSSPEASRYHLRMGLFNMLMEFMRDSKIVLGEYQIVIDCKFKPIAELDVYEFYRECLSPSLSSYVKNRTFIREKELAVRISGCPEYASNLIKLTRFTTQYYSSQMRKENAELVNAALDMASEEVKTRSISWAFKVSSLIINAYLFMLASIYHSEGKLPEPELYFELWFMGIYDLKELKELYVPLLNDLQGKIR